MDRAVGEDVGGIEEGDGYDQNIFHEILKELIKIIKRKL